MVLVGYKVGGNIDMNFDGHIGGEKVLYEKGSIAQIKSTKKRNISQLLGLKNYPGEPICCIVIVEGKEELFGIRYGIDFSKNKVRDESDVEEYFYMNIGSDKYHPCGPTCTNKGGKVPCLVEFLRVRLYQRILSRAYLCT